MISEKIIKFVEGELSIMEIEELEQEFLKHPELLEVVGGLNRIQKVIPPSEKLSDHIQKKKIQIRAKICNTKQVEEKTLTDLNDVNIQEEVDQATKLTTHSSECATPEDEYINAQPHIEYDTDNINTQQINDIDEPIETLEAT